MISSALTTECPSCGKVLKVTAEQAGMRVRCPGCQEAFEVTSVGFSRTESSAYDQVELETHDAPQAVRLSQRTTGGTIGRFELRAELGRGGFGQVYRAYDPVLEREVALKLPRFASAEESERQRFIQEAKSAAKLKHPNIVGVYESGEADGQPYIVTELVRGETLSQRLKLQRPEVTQAVEWTRDLAEALAYAHRGGIVHRDIKPENIMLGADDRPQIMDFGLAKREDEESLLTTEGSILGTPAYMSPEQARGDLQLVGPASDQYSLGATLYQLLTGQPPFSGPPHQVIAAVTSIEPPAVRRLNDKVPIDLQAIIQKAMHKDYSQRYADISLFASDLDRWLRGEPVRARPLSRLGQVVRWSIKHRVVAGALLTVLAAFAIGFGVSFIQWQRAELEARRANLAIEREQEAAQLATEAAEIAQAAAEAMERQNQELEAANKESRTQSLAARRAAKSEKLAADEAKRQEQISREARLEVQKNLYVAQIRLAAEAWKAGARAECEDLLTVASGAGHDMDGLPWEWGYLNTLANSEVLRKKLADTSFNYSDLSGGWSPDGTQFAIARDDCGFSLFDARDGERITDYEGKLPVSEYAVGLVAWNPVQNLIAVSAKGFHSVAIWDKTAGKRIDLIKVTAIDPPKSFADQTKFQQVADIAWSPDGNSLAIGVGNSRYSSRGIYQIEIWSKSPLKLTRSIPFAGDIPTGFCWSYDSQSIILESSNSASGSASIRKIDVTASSEKKLLFKMANGPYAAQFNVVAASHSGKYLAVGDNQGFVRILDAESGDEKNIRRLHQREVRSLSWSPVEDSLASGGIDNRVVLWKGIGNYYSEPDIVAVYDQPVSQVQWSRKGHRLLVTRTSREISILEGLRSPQGSLWSSPGQTMDGAWSPDGKLFAISSVGSPSLAVWDVGTGEQIWTRKYDPKQKLNFLNSRSIAWLPTNDSLLVTSYSDASKGYNASVIGMKNSEFKPWMEGVDFIESAQAGEELFLVSQKESSSKVVVQSWHPRTDIYKPIAEFSKASVYSIRVSQDGRRFAAGSGTVNRGIQVWDVPQQKFLSIIPSQSNTNLCFSPNGVFLAYAETYERVSVCRIWNIDAARPGPSLRSHPGGTTALSWHPTQPRLATAGVDGTVKIHDTTTGKELLSLETSDQTITGIAWSPDGLRLAAWGSGFIRLWDASKGLEKVGAAAAP